MATNNRRTQLRATGSAALVATFGLAICAACASGCYQRVTRASGFGADQYEVSEPYQRNSAVDDWIFGKQDRTPSSGSRIPPTPPRN